MRLEKDDKSLFNCEPLHAVSKLVFLNDFLTLLC